MKSVAIMALQPGMVLGEDVIHQNRVIFPANTTLDETIISKLKRYSVMCVTIMENVDFATTHHEKLRYNNKFLLFEHQYNIAMQSYKFFMQNFFSTGVKIDDAALLSIYSDLKDKIDSGAELLDYLYNMIPNEDEMTYSHCVTSALLAGTIADWLSMNEEARKTMVLCGFYYDIGKLFLPNELLWKPGKLTDDEIATIRKHPEIGYDMVKNLNMNQHVKNSVIMHHERLDGTGYPYRLNELTIDKYARYMAIIDAYVAMASPRSYRSAFTPLSILADFEKRMDQFDTELLLPIMKRIADAQIGTTVTLNDDSKWEVMIIHPTKFSRPLLRNDKNEILDLMQNPELYIK
ncbi:MAG: HD domain-containing protein [Lachnospiraceae bacterium]|nr:HD domain-containing protein [Lachnospiraceae bacterium]